MSPSATLRRSEPIRSRSLSGAPSTCSTNSSNSATIASCRRASLEESSSPSAANTSLCPGGSVCSSVLSSSGRREESGVQPSALDALDALFHTDSQSGFLRIRPVDPPDRLPGVLAPLLPPALFLFATTSTLWAEPVPCQNGRGNPSTHTCPAVHDRFVIRGPLFGVG